MVYFLFYVYMQLKKLLATLLLLLLPLFAVTVAMSSPVTAVSTRKKMSTGKDVGTGPRKCLKEQDDHSRHREKKRDDNVGDPQNYLDAPRQPVAG